MAMPLQSLGDLFNPNNATAGKSPFLQVTPASKYINDFNEAIADLFIIVLPVCNWQESLTAGSLACRSGAQQRLVVTWPLVSDAFNPGNMKLCYITVA